jgi:hypothetical protein
VSRRPYKAPAVVRSWWIYHAPLELLALMRIGITMRSEPGTWTRVAFGGQDRNVKGWRKP